LQPIFAGNGFSLSTENPTPGELISNRLASSLSDIPNSLTALSAVPAQAGQKQKRLLAFTYEYLLTLNSTYHDVMQDTGCLPATCPPLPEMPTHKLNAVSGVGRRVARLRQGGRASRRVSLGMGSILHLRFPLST